MAELTLNQFLRCAHVKRWHIVRVARDQNLAEHQWCVAIIAMHMMKWIAADADSEPWAEDVQELWRIVMHWSLFHDTPEVITGDMPTPMAARGHKSIQLERSLSANWSQLQVDANDYAAGLPAMIVKLADITADLLFMEEEGIGKHSEGVTEGIAARLRNKTHEAKQTFPNIRWHHLIAAMLTEARATIHERQE